MEALQIWLQTLEEAKLIVQDSREQLEAEIDRLRVTGGATEESDDLEAASAIRTGAHRQRLRAGMYKPYSRFRTKMCLETGR